MQYSCNRDNIDIFVPSQLWEINPCIAITYTMYNVCSLCSGEIHVGGGGGVVKYDNLLITYFCLR